MDFEDLLFWMGIGYATAADRHDVAEIRPGMSSEEVRRILGSPSRIDAGSGHADVVWVYLDLLDSDYFEVHFREGRVVRTSC